MRTWTRLTLLLLLVAVPSSLAVHLTHLDAAQDALLESATEAEARRVASLAVNASAYVVNLEDALAAVGLNPAFYRGFEGQATQKSVLNVLVARHPPLTHVRFLTPDGDELAAASAFAAYEDPQSFKDQDGLREARSGRVVYEPPYLDPSAREYFMRMWAPVSLFEGEVRGVLVADVRLQNLLDELVQEEPRDGGAVYVMDARGVTIAHRDRATLLAAGPASAAQVMDGAQTSRTGTFLTTDADGRELIVSFEVISGTRWVVVSERPTSAAFARLDALSGQFTQVAILAVVAVFGVSTFTSRHFARPIQALDLAATRLRTGDLETPIVRRSSGEIGNLEATMDAMRRDLLASVRDLEARVAARTSQLADAREEVKMLNELLTHDVSNYVMPAENHLRAVARQGGLDEKSAARIATAARNVARIRELVGHVRSLARLEEPGAEAAPLAVTNAATVLKDAVARVRDMFPGVTVEVEWDLPDEEPTVAADALLLDVFLNLVSNAVKYSEVPWVRLSVEAAELDGAPAWAVRVADRGLGIPDHEKAELFRRYHRPNRPLRGHTTGVGLALGRRIVQAHSGTLSIEDRVAGGHTKGSVFVVTLPAARADD